MDVRVAGANLIQRRALSIAWTSVEEEMGRGGRSLEYAVRY